MNTQAEESYEKITTATAEATDLIKSGYSTAVKGAQDYNNKLLEFAQTKSRARLCPKAHGREIAFGIH